MKDIVKIFKALSDESRIKILNIISNNNVCSKRIAREVEISEAAVSQHIKILKEAHLISGYKRGYHMIFQINPHALEILKNYLHSLSTQKEIVSFKCTKECKNKGCYCKKGFKEDSKMKICFPVSNNLGLESVPYGHFGTAPMFVVCDLASNEVRVINNGDLNHVHGNCSPIKAIKGEVIDIVVVNGIGQGAINGLNNNGIKVFKAVEGTIGENLKAYSEGRLVEFSRKNACNHEGCSH